MLQTIREYTQGWIASVIISIIILTFALWGIHSYFLGGGANENVATVNGVEITQRELSTAYERLKKQIQSQYGSQGINQNQNVIKDRALQTLIDTEVLKQASVSEGFFVGDHQVDVFLQNIPEFQVNGQFSVQRFQELLAQSMLSPEEFLSLVKANILIDQPKLGIIFSAFALPNETKAALELINQQRDINYLVIPYNYSLLKPITISDKEITSYYDAHKNQFKTNEQMSVNYIELSAKEIANSISVSDDKLKSFYNENISSYTKPLQWKISYLELPNAEDTDVQRKNANNIVAGLKSNKNPAVLASQFHAKLTTTDWVNVNQITKELQSKIDQVTQANVVVGPIQTENSLLIAKIIAVQLPQIQKFEDVKAKVKDLYVRQQAEEKFADLKDRLADLTYEHPESLDNAANTLKLPIKTSDVFSKDQEGTGIAKSKKVRDIAFSNDILTMRNNSDVIPISNENVVVIRLNKYTPSSVKSLAEVKGTIESQLKNEAAEKEVKKISDATVDKLNQGGNATTIASELKLPWTNAGSTGRFEKSIDPAILDATFAMPHPKNGKTVYAGQRLEKGYVIIALKKVTPGVLTDKKEEELFAEQVQNGNGMLEYELYKQALVAQAKIKK